MARAADAPHAADDTGAPPSLAAQVIAWQASSGRHDLPWQRTRDPYRVWLSEIMLQQTQVATVLGYYSRFLARFPNVAALAAAPLDEVLGLWSGLGYYSRARNLHRCAQAVVAEHGGAFPPTAAQLATLPGIGRSTAAAIAAFCFGERVAILDGNVKRVLTRVLAFDADLAQAASERRLWDEATRLLPADPGGGAITAYTQGLMDLGASLCSQRAPACGVCPVLSNCRAGQAGEALRYPVKTRKLKRSQREHHWLSLAWRDRLWLVQRPPTGIWAGLWSLCEYADAQALATATADWPGDQRSLPPFTHVLTHLDWRLHPVQHRLPDDLDERELAAYTGRMALRSSPGIPSQLAEAGPLSCEGRWFGRDELATLGLPAALRKLLDAL
jgi:A/G-specific adenine glycosylase